MSTTGCSRAELVEALRDGRLGPQDRVSMERHVGTCAVCGGLAHDLGRIGEALREPIEPATPLEHQRARLALLRRAAEGSAPQPRPSFGLRFALAAATLSAAVAMGWVGARATAPAAAPVALHMRPPPRLATARETTLKPSDDARFERTRAAEMEVVALANGTIDFTVRPLARGERFVVRTADAEVEVRGTAFRVQAEQGKIRSVSVAEGSVEVRYAGFAATIPAGGSWRATAEAPAPPPPPVAAAPAAPIAEPARVAAAPEPARVAAPPRARVVARAEPPRPPAPPEPVAAPPEAPAPPPAPAVSPASRAFADAMSAMRRGDYAGSAAQLEKFASAHGADARTDEAEYLRAVALQRAGRGADAAEAAKRYLERRPDGAHRAEAKRIAAR